MPGLGDDPSGWSSIHHDDAVDVRVAVGREVPTDRLGRRGVDVPSLQRRERERELQGSCGDGVVALENDVDVLRLRGLSEHRPPNHQGAQELPYSVHRRFSFLKRTPAGIGEGPEQVYTSLLKNK